MTKETPEPGTDAGLPDDPGVMPASVPISELAMMAVRAAGQKPLMAVDGVLMASEPTSEFPLILEDALAKAVARRLADGSTGEGDQ